MVKSIFKTCVIPLSKVYEKILWLRRFNYQYGFGKQKYAPLPVISVGNLDLGGTGKTPLTQWVVQYILGLEKSPLILMRGHKGKKENSGGCLRANEQQLWSSQKYGDEAILHVRNLSKGGVIVGKRRFQNLLKYYEQIKGDCIILDDGLQHLKIYRQLNICTINCNLEFNQFKMFPNGVLREGLSALKDVDFVVLNYFSRENYTIEKETQFKCFLQKYLSKHVQFASVYYKTIGLYNFTSTRIYLPKDLSKMNVFVVSAIGHNENFLNSLKFLGCNILKTFFFKDHYSYKLEEIKEIQSLAKNNQATIITTEKDAVKIFDLGHFPEVYYLKIECDFISGGELLEQQIKTMVL